MRTIRLRSKFLLSLIMITAGLTSLTLLIVRASVEKQAREAIREDLRNSVRTYESFEQQREFTLTHSAGLIANLPLVRALMTTGDAPTIQDASADIWRLSGSDMLVMAGRSGNILGFRANAGTFSQDAARALLPRSLNLEGGRDWWSDGTHLFEVWIRPVYFGQSSSDATMGYLVLGDEMDAAEAKTVGRIAASDVAFEYDKTLIASTLTSDQQSDFSRRVVPTTGDSAGPAQEIEIGDERYLIRTVVLSAPNSPLVSLSVLKSFDRATSFIQVLNHMLLGLGLLSIVAGSILVFWISDTFTRPLANLVEGVRALDRGDFNYPLENQSGDEVGEVTTAFDRMRTNLQRSQAEHKSLEERLRQAHKMEAVGRLAGGVAHDFNNLLTIIRGHADLLMDRASTDDASRRSAEQIHKASNRAVSMTRQLLAFSRMQVLQPRILDLNTIMNDMGKMLPRLIGEHIEFVFVPDPKLSTIKADPGQVEQVIMNLAVNARDAMPDGGKLVIRTRNAVLSEADTFDRPPMLPGEYVLLSVTDTGHGMTAETRAHIFEPFFTTKDVGKGTGLGLATVYGVVKQSDGFIWVDSEAGKGATFEIYFPQARGRVSDVADEVKPLAKTRGNETVLVVEDEPDVRELARAFLTANGYSVIEARDGVEALEIVQQFAGTIHAVITDMVMPRMSGMQLGRELKAMRPGTKIVWMTGYTEYSSSQPSDGPANPNILQKPFSMESLVGKLREVLATNSAQEQPRDPSESYVR